MKFNFIKPTLIFAIVGLFIPGFTAIVLFGIQMLLSIVGIECSTAWTIICTISIISGLILPYLFYRHITRLSVEKLQSLKTRLTFFNLFEYIFIQASLTPLLYAGAGLAVTAKENLEKSIDDLVEKGKISDGEGKKIIDEFFEKTENRKKEFEEKLTKVTEEIANKMNYVKKTDVDALVKRVEELEAKVAKSKKADATA